MRLLKIGRDPSCNIVLNSDKVSALHAEIIILNNGDILLEDKNSRNGTFMMNRPIKPGTPISVRRGDAIRFGDVELNWGLVPMPEDNSAYKALFGIGTNFRNEIQVSGNTVSRFHATLKIGKDGNAYLQDHSKNGTTVNGQKLVSGHNTKIRRKDAVVCGGVPVDLSSFIPPMPLKKVSIAFAAVAILLGVVFLLKGIIPPLFNSSKPSDYIPATTMVYGHYHYTVTIKDDPFIQVLKEYGINLPYPESYDVGLVKGTEKWGIMTSELFLSDLRIPKGESLVYTGTAFFVSNDGKMMTNRHVACPWLYLSSKEKDGIKQFISEIREKLLPINELRTYADLERLFNADNYLTICIGAIMNSPNLKVDLNTVNAWITRYKHSEIEISGTHDFLAVGYAGNNYDSANEFDRCHVLQESGDEKVDLAILQLNNPVTPQSIKKVVDLKNAVTDASKIEPLEENYYYIGYPSEVGGLGYNLRNEDGGLKPVLNEVKFSKSPGQYICDLQGQVFGGASGSPILTKDGRLIGVVNASYRFTTMSFGVLAKYAKDLFEKTEKNKK